MAIGNQRLSGEVSTPTDKRIEAENAFAALTLPPATLPTVAASWERDRAARIKLGLPLINRAKPDDDDDDDEQQGDEAG